MALTAKSIIDRARTTLVDESEERWSDEELLGYLNDGLRAITNHKPSANTSTYNLDLVPGSFQLLGDEDLELMSVYANVTYANTDPSRQNPRYSNAPVVVSFDDIRRTGENENWLGEDADPVVRTLIYNPENPREFGIAPPQPDPATTRLRVMVSQTPPVVGIDDNIPMRGIYETPLFYYVVYGAHTKSTSAAAPMMAEKYFAMFANFLGIRVRVVNEGEEESAR